MRSTTKRPDAALPLLAAGAVAVAGAAALLWARHGEETSAPTSAPVTLPAPAVEPPAPVPAAGQPAAPSPSAAGLRLFGLLGRGAIIALPDGMQRFFTIGREVRPGLRVARIAQDHVVLASAGGEVRLGFDGPRSVAQPAAETGTATSSGAEAALRNDTITYRLGLAPRQAGGRGTGYVVRPGVSMPALERAGLRPGDVIVGVNGSRFDEERLLELSWQMANSDRTDFEVERNGSRVMLTSTR